MTRRYIIMAVCVIVVVLVASKLSGDAEADHGRVRCGGTGQLSCILERGPIVELIKQQAEITWCLDARAANYPNFVADVTQVTQDFAEKLGVTHRRVNMPASRTDMSCLVRHEMPDNHGCSGCGAWVFLPNIPVVVEYNWKQGYRFLSTIGHEAGHWSCLLDEHYDKAGFRSWILNYGYWQHGAPTVMDSGTPYVSGYAPYGIWYLTEYDLARCSETLGKQVPPPVGCLSQPNEHNHRWDQCKGVWRAADGNFFVPERGWAFASCNGDRLRWFFFGSVFLVPGTPYFDPTYNGEWAEVPAC